MGIGPAALKLYEDLDPKGASICELGSQDYVPGPYRGRLYFREIFSSREFMTRHLGFQSYVCIDLNGEHEAIPLDLNVANAADLHNRMFDVVTNHGTSEHIFNQSNCFKLIHDLTARDGLMIHILPMQDYPRHGFYNCQPVLFEELAAANRYELLRCYGHDDQFGTLLVVAMRKPLICDFVMPQQRQLTALEMSKRDRWLRRFKTKATARPKPP